MRLFVSYRRKTWPFTHRLADQLRRTLRATVFVDVDSIDEDDFQSSILTHLHASDVFLLIVSEHTFDPERIQQSGDWVRREIREALEHDIPIVLALVDGFSPPPAENLPDDIRAVATKQGIEFYPRYFDAAVDELAAFIRRVAKRHSPPPDWRRIVIAVVGLVVIAGLAWGAVDVMRGIAEGARNHPTLTPQPTEISTRVPGDTPVPTRTQPPTGMPGPTLTAGERARQLAEAGVTRNVDWTPHTEVIAEAAMALVPAGCFQMGGSITSEEQPVHVVCFEEPYWIDVTEVTNGQYGATEPDCTEWSLHENQPRICVNWFNALTHCQARGARLPTEAEWEYAARGPDGLVYPWGNEFVADNVVSYNNSEGRTWAAGSKPGGVSWVGALDLSGNVWEWVSDWYSEDYYGTLASGVVNPRGPDSGQYRVLKGGSWVGNDDLVRAANRGLSIPIESRHDGVGFRCALSYSP